MKWVLKSLNVPSPQSPDLFYHKQNGWIVSFQDATRFTDEEKHQMMETTYARFQHLEADMWVPTDDE
jgi:hypothetical protein